MSRIPPTILIIDDSNADREWVRRLLPKSQEVITASGAQTGIRAYQSHRPSCVLLDLGLPGVEGVEVLEALVDLGAAVIILTGHGDEARAVAAMKAGARDYLTKDGLTEDILQKSVRYVLETAALERARSSAAGERDALAARKHVLESILQQTTDFVGALDREGRTVFVNPAGKELLGLGNDPDRPWFSEAQGCRLSDEILDVVNEDGSWSGLFELEDADGTAIPTDAVIVRHAATVHHAEFISLLCRDRREHIAAEEELRNVQRLEAVGRLAGGIAHDFNNLITAIVSFSGFVRDDLPTSDPRRADLDEVISAADRAADLTRQLLTFAKRQPTAPRRFDLAASVLAMELLLQRTAGEAIDFNLVTPNSPAFVRGDISQVDQIVLNLVVNAKDAMPGGGRLDVAVEVDVAASCVELRVSDDGTGMDEETRAHVFDPFFTTKGPDEGTGLGLATCYGIVSDLLGTIHIDSELGAGTTFTVRLPYAGEPSSNPAPAMPVPPRDSIGIETILVVEDDHAVRRLAARALKERGYGVLVADSVPTARASFSEHRDQIALVFMDVTLPGGHGLDLVAELREIQPLLRVLMTSGYADFEHGEVDEALQWLWKPYAPVTLARRVREVLDAQPNST